VSLRRPPPGASFATRGAAGRLHAPSAARNGAAIAEVVAAHAPATGRALEIASGTGEHVLMLARRLPGLIWQPTDADPARLASIAAWAAGEPQPNLRAPLLLDATRPGWSAELGGRNLILLVNLLHLLSRTEAEGVVREIGRALAPGGVALIYGPFLRGEAFASPGDAAFHASLSGADPEVGYKDFALVQDWQRQAGLVPEAPVEMPANNLFLIARR
jgi:SAM-dependent methyltransferase